MDGFVHRHSPEAVDSAGTSEQSIGGKGNDFPRTNCTEQNGTVDGKGFLQPFCRRWKVVALAMQWKYGRVGKGYKCKPWLE